MKKIETNVYFSEDWIRADIDNVNQILQETINDFVEENEIIINIQMVTSDNGCSRFWIYTVKSENSNKTLIQKWDKYNQCSIRLRNALDVLIHPETKEKIIYIEDITHNILKKQLGVGGKSITEFFELLNS